MNWHPATKPPDSDRQVLGIVLNRFVNADWKLSEPHVYRYKDDNYVGYSGSGRIEQPDMWCEIDLPPLPECKEREKAIEIGRRYREFEQKVEELRKEL